MKSQDKYDIIIKKITKDWNKFMESQDKKEKWITPKYSKKEINQAGSIIANPLSADEERNNALIVLNNWRSAHAYPLQVICNNLRFKNPNAIVVQRLKRLDSIIGKIERFPDMKLYRMQDLGGCRVIVDTIDQVYDVVNNYKKSRIRHIFKKENDYIQSPKPSGYRSYHIVYQFHSDKKETYNKNILIEIQFRTKLQHIWATALETMGIYTNNNLKASQGNKDILKFFTLVSSVFAIQENTNVCPDTSNQLNELIEEIKDLDQKHHIIDTLNGIKIVISHISNKKITDKNIYFMLILDYLNRKITIKTFKSSEIEIATQFYSEVEKSADKNTVLVSATSFDSLREAYPNYFADISGFVRILKKYY